MYVLGVMGSPRKGSNSDLLLDTALNTAVGQGARADKVYLYDLNMRPCYACEGCRAGDGCVQDDDMQLLYPKIWDADGLIIATPVYWWGPSAQTKAFLDRWYALVPGDIMRGKRVAVLCAHEDDDPQTARHLLGMFDESFRYLNMQVVGTLAAVAGKRGEVVRNQQAMAGLLTWGVSSYVVERVARWGMGPRGFRCPATSYRAWVRPIIYIM